MALPKQVQKQAEAVAEYDKALEQANKEPEQKPAEEPKQEAQPPAETPTEQVAPAAPPLEQPKPEPWEQRYRSLQGQFNQMVPALQGQIKDLQAKLTELQTKPPEPVKQPDKVESLVSSKDVEAFGEDLVDLARRIAREEFGQREQNYRSEIAALKDQLTATTGKVESVTEATSRTASEMFFDRLTAALPQWQQLQSTEECQQWLATRVPGTQMIWNDALQNAAAAASLEGVLEVFGEFINRHPQYNPKRPAPAPTAPAVNPAKAELQRQVAPAKSKSTAAPTGGDKRLYTSGDYSTESMRQLRLFQQGRYDEASALEAELNAAVAEGRVRP